MDIALRAGLPKLFVLALLQTYSHSHCECREEKKIEHFMEKKKKNNTDKKSKLSQGKGANITELNAKKKELTQELEEMGKNGRRNGRRWGRNHGEACLGSFFDLSF